MLTQNTPQLLCLGFEKLKTMELQNLPTATQVAYYHNCHRELWLFAHNVNMEQTSALVAEGKLISETTYRRRPAQYTEVALGPIKVDFYDVKNRVIHETKKSKKRDDLHLWQLKYYIYVFELAGVEGVSGMLEYPRLRVKEAVELTAADRAYLKEIVPKVNAIKELENCPERLERKYCKNCSYEAFCWVG